MMHIKLKHHNRSESSKREQAETSTDKNSQSVSEPVMYVNVIDCPNIGMIGVWNISQFAGEAYEKLFVDDQMNRIGFYAYGCVSAVLTPLIQLPTNTSAWIIFFAAHLFWCGQYVFYFFWNVETSKYTFEKASLCTHLRCECIGWQALNLYDCRNVIE